MNSLFRNSVLIGLGFALGFSLGSRKPFSGLSYFPRSGDTASPESLQKRLSASEERYRKNPDDLNALVDAGVAHYLLGPEHYADALNAFNGAWRQGALDKRIFYYTGILYENLSLFPQAQRQYERFLKHAPEDREIQLRLARLLFRGGNWEESILYYKKFVDKNPKDVTSLINLGLAYRKKAEESAAASARDRKKATEEEKAAREADAREALNYLEQAKALAVPLPEGVERVLAQLYLDQGRWDPAVQSAEAELKISPDDKETLKILAFASEKAGQKEKALEVYKKLLEKDPRNGTWKAKVRSLSPKPRK